MITHGPSAGTPDFGAEQADHEKYDVAPFLWLPLADYHAVWTPNQGELVMPGGELTDTGWEVQRGEHFEIQARGTVVWGQRGSSCGPRGASLPAETLAGLLLAPPLEPRLPTGALLGIIVAPAGHVSAPFYVGEHRRVQALMRGRLYLVINDGFIENNRGAFFVSIRRVLSHERVAGP